MPDDQKPLLVYIVEDSTIMLRLLTGAVEAARAELLGHSDNAPQAIAELSRLEPDLILVDMALRAGSGLDVLNALQQGGFARRAVKVVLTNHATDEHRSRSLKLGATHFLDKSSEGWQALEIITKMANDKRAWIAGSSARDMDGEPNNHGKH